MIEVVADWAITNSDPANLVALVVIYHRLDNRLLKLRDEVTDDDSRRRRRARGFLPRLRGD